jgi:hypothetical protein
MKTRTVKVTRTITLVKSIIMEIPEGLTDYELESALIDECNVHERFERQASIYDMPTESDEFDVEYSSEPAHEDFTIANEDWLEALKDDECIPAEA